MKLRYGACTALCLASLTTTAHSQDSTFTLGRITVTAPEYQESRIDDAVVTQEEMWTFNTDTLDETVKLIPGVTATQDANGRRNEHDILVRGYGRWQVPLSIDGIRVYLPADNRLDFNRFLTADLAEVQVRKGYASVLDGPGGLGGAINLVTRKPTKAFETEFQSGAAFGNDASYDGWNGAARIGTRQEQYYAQLAGSYLDRDHWRLSDDFTPTAIEDGGERNESANRDWRVNAKFGFTPNDTDEYSLSFTSQSGKKNAPLNVLNNPPNPANSFWRWPWWNIQNVYFLSNTQFGDSTYLKTRLFYNTFENALYAYDNGTYTTQSNMQRFRSIYDDNGKGGSIEVGTGMGERNTLRAAVHYRRDEHNERNYNRPTHPTASSAEPWQQTRENTWSLALENTFAATADLDLVAGVSYDKNDLELAQEFNTTAGLFELPTRDDDAVNGQVSTRWRYARDSQLHASVSSRVRFPTIFERYSTRFGSALPNPDLRRERGVNYEIGWSRSFSEATKVSAAVFYNDVQDMIQTLIVIPTPQTTQTQNVGDGEYYGVELAADTQINEQLRFGFNYTYLKRKIELGAGQPLIRPTGTPENQGFAFLSYQPIDSLTIMPSVEVADDRWSEITATTYTQLGNYVLANLQVQYRMGDTWDFVVGGRNLLDEDFTLAYGLPEPGRSYFAKFRAQF